MAAQTESRNVTLPLLFFPLLTSSLEKGKRENGDGRGLSNKALMTHDLCATFHSFYNFNLWWLSDIITELL